MLAVYRTLLYLYPTEHRRQFGGEMLSVFEDVWSEKKSFITLIAISIREFTGLLKGAVRAHFRGLNVAHADLSLPWRFTMQNGFRFPKATPILMTLILAGILMTIKRGEDILNSLPHVNPQIAPIHAVHSTLLPIFGIVAAFYGAGLIGAAILLVVRRSSTDASQK